MKITILFLITFMCINKINAQILKTQKDMSGIRLNKTHLELDIKNIFTGLNGASILYKRRLESKKYVKVNSLMLLRVSGTFSYEVEVTRDKNALIPTTIDEYLPDNGYAGPYSLYNKIGVGLEWQKMNKGFVHYVGSEIVFGLDKFYSSYYRTAFISSALDYQTIQESSYLNYSFGFNPFFGIKYYFNSQLSIGIETGVYLGYQLNRTKTISYRTDNTSAGLVTTETPLPDRHSSKILTQFNNLRFLTVGYCF